MNPDDSLARRSPASPSENRSGVEKADATAPTRSGEQTGSSTLPTVPAAEQAGVLVSLATYNERENLPPLVEQIQTLLPEANILIVDDNSPDGTGVWAQDRAATDPRFHCVVRPGKLGLGSAGIAAMQYAVQHGYRYVINMDADFSHSPIYLPALILGMQPGGDKRVDVMIGSRYVAGGGTEGWPWSRKWMSRGVNTYARWLLRLPVRDCSGGFRCFRSERLADVDFARIASRGYSFHEEVLWHLKRAGAQFAETPIVFVDRRYGSSKLNWREALYALWRIFCLGLRERLGRRPSRR